MLTTDVAVNTYRSLVNKTMTVCVNSKLGRCLQASLDLPFLFPNNALTLPAPRVLVPTPSTMGGSKRTLPQYLKNEKCYKLETFGEVRSIL